MHVCSSAPVCLHAAAKPSSNQLGHTTCACMCIVIDVFSTCVCPSSSKDNEFRIFSNTACSVCSASNFSHRIYGIWGNLGCTAQSQQGQTRQIGMSGLPSSHWPYTLLKRDISKVALWQRFAIPVRCISQQKLVS